MKRESFVRIAAVLAAVSLMTIGGYAHAGVPGWLQYGIDRMFGGFLGANPQWQQTGSYSPNDWGDLTLANTFKDSSGGLLTLFYCVNSSFGSTLQTVCSSPPNACGATGSGFVSDFKFYNGQGVLVNEVYTPCTAQTPSDSICPPKCTPQSICHADGNLYDSCTNALVKSCAAGCASNQCNTTVQCTSQNVCAADGNVHDSCTGALITTCPYGCSDGKCVTADIRNGTTTQPIQCTSQNICYADGNVHDSCTGTLIRGCPNGCVNNHCSDICISRIKCSSDGNLHESCSGALTTICKWGCTDNYCNRPPPGTISSFSVKPSLVTSGTISTASWKVKNVTSCTVTGTNGDSWQSSGDGSFSDPTSRIVGQTSYTLQCMGLDGSPVSATAIVNLIPTFHEQ